MPARPEPAAGRAPAEGPGGPERRVPSSSWWWRPGRGCCRSPHEARDRRWAGRRGRFLRRRCAQLGMEQDPQGVFQEDLEWCISQLEADLHLIPHRKLAEETQHIFKVLHSPETPLAEKQQVMSNEFGDCHLKMDEGQKSMEKGVTPDVVEVQPSKRQASDGVKQSDPAPESEEQLWKEVDWCMNQLELGLKTQKPTQKQAEEALRAIRTLRSDKAPLVKKRQLMRAMFGDYRKKMQEELCRELKLMETAAKSAKIMELKGSIHKKNGQFVRKCLGACRKSHSLAESPSESHRTLSTGLFNFSTPQEFHFNFF
ncbi:UPF0488 protein C8orf33 homolog isoform X4 [Taeniopygia guttata]|uniref:UPF0488 protein C8orf33 homolog isoform X4 n=1 Tax=Taeniopygia guttata TaxID=59729 RepID=UPI001BC8ACBF|nr:UPF0488 protein C8orf33 homolog isoform X4 [Taeniopygia guttata]